MVLYITLDSVELQYSSIYTSLQVVKYGLSMKSCLNSVCNVLKYVVKVYLSYIVLDTCFLCVFYDTELGCGFRR